MIPVLKVSIEVRSGAARFDVAVRAESIRTNTYGGVYVWRSREAMESYKQTDIYKGIGTNPHFVDVTVKDFAVLEGPTRVTGGPAAFAA